MEIQEENNAETAILPSTNSNVYYTYDEFLSKIGGFGRFQLFASVVLLLNFTTGGQIMYGLQFLEDYPDYECLENGKWGECDR